jgi:dienelactone hydrolase
VHGKESDPFFDEDLAAARALAESAADSELFLYPGEEHLFLDASLPAYDAAATSLVVERALSFLERVPVNA